MDSRRFPLNDRDDKRCNLGKLVSLVIRLSVKSIASNWSLVTARCSMAGMDRPRRRISRSPRALVRCSDCEIISAESLIVNILF